MGQLRRSETSRPRRLGARWSTARILAAVATLSVLVGVLPLTAAAQNAPTAAQPAATVEPAVEEALAAEGVADFWVLFRTRADLSQAEGIADWTARGQYVYDQLTSTASETQAELVAELTARSVVHQSFFIVNAIRVTGGDQAVLDLARSRPDVEAIIAPVTYAIPEPIAEPESGIAAVEWGIANIHADDVWARFGRGEGIVVANIDSGVQFDHPALVNQYRGNLGGGSFDHNYNWFDPSLVCGNPSLVPCDNNGHGTHTMGTMVGDDGGGNQIGVAPAVRWMAAKGCETTGCSDSALLASGQFILAPTDLTGENPMPELRPNVVNNSWGGPGGDPWFDAMNDAWTDAGIFGMWSNGNSGPSCNTAGSPGDGADAYSAGAYDIGNNIAGFSSRGFGRDGTIKPNIAAPGVNVRSSRPGSTYGNLSGTSMAAPHVSGTVALMWSAAPDLIGEIAQTRQLLDDTAIDVNNTSCGGTADDNNVFGEGRLDAFAAVDASPRGATGALSGTVTDSATGTGIAGATVSLAVDGLPRSATTDADGNYSFASLPVGTYDVTANAFGHLPATASAVITEGATTDLDLALTAQPAVTVSGRVLDGSGHGWALYAKVTVAGAGVSDYSDPFTGAYSLSLPANATYTLIVEPQYPGYETLSEPITVGAADIVHDLIVTVQPFACREAPGYEFEAEIAMITTDPGGQFADYFDGLGADVDFFTVAQLAQVTGYDTVVWGYSATIANEAAFQSFLDATDASGAGVVFLDHAFANGNGIKTLSRYTGQPVSVSTSTAGTGQPNLYEVTQEHPILEGFAPGQQLLHEPAEAGWLAWFTGYEGDGRQIIANAGRSGGGTFGAGIGVDERQSNRHALLSLHSSSATRGPADWSAESEQIFWNALQWVSPGVTFGCVVVEGGLVAGIVRDDNTNAGVVGAVVTSDDDPTTTATTAATPDDPELPDGFYWMFSSLTGRHPFTASADDYVSQTRRPVVVADAVTEVDFRLAAGLLTVVPDSLQATIAMGGSATRTFRITNEGTAPVDVELTESGGGFEMLGGGGPATATVLRPTSNPETADPSRGSGPTAGVGRAPSPGEAQWATNGPAGTGRTVTPTRPQANAPDAVTITHSASQVVAAVNSAACSGGGTTRENGYLRTFVLEDFDITSDFDITNVSFGIETLTIPQMVTVKLYTLEGAFIYANMNPIGSAEASLQPQQLTIVDVPVTGTAPAGSTLVVEVDVPDMPTGGLFFIGSNDAGQTAPSYLRSATCGLPEPTDTSQVGFPDMHIVMNVTGEAGGDVPWLSVNPPAFTLQPGQSVRATVIIDGNVDQPGAYTAQVAIAENTPYTVDPVDVTMNVRAPGNWGKITGTATGIACDGSTGPLEGAIVHIDGRQFDVTLTTDADGFYAYWIGVSNNPLQMIVAANGHIPQTRTAAIVPRQTVVENFALRELC